MIYSNMKRHLKITKIHENKPSDQSELRECLPLQDIKVMLVKGLVTAAGQTQKLSKIVIPIREQNIQLWVNQKQNYSGYSGLQIFESIMQDYTRILVECFDITINSVKHTLKSGSEEKMFRVKNDQRKKIRLLKNRDNFKSHYESLEDEKQKDQYIQQIFELKDRNKKLQKKILLISSEFKQLKSQYELEIKKYQQILNSSLSNLSYNLNQVKFTNFNPTPSQPNQPDPFSISRIPQNERDPSHYGTQYQDKNSKKEIKRYLSDHNLRIN